MRTRDQLRSFRQNFRAALDVRPGITQTQLATDIGLSVSQMNNIACGRNWPSLSVYFKLCEKLGMDAPLMPEEMRPIIDTD